VRVVKAGEKVDPESLNAGLIAPCGMDCGLCSGHLREKGRCDGCNGGEASKPTYCVTCPIKLCDARPAGEGHFCFECSRRFPCARLRRLDKRYRTKYGMSMLENLETIRDAGIENFVAAERVRWKCESCGGVVCVHQDRCIYCGGAKTRDQAAGNGRERAPEC
jgi:hypothetical protein